MADKQTRELDPVKESPINGLPEILELYDDTMIPVQQQDKAMRMTGKQFRQFGEKAAEIYVQSASDSANSAAQSLEEIGQIYVATDTAREAAETAASRASQSEQNASDILTLNEDVAVRTPYIGGSGNWFVWNNTTNAYEDSGTQAQGKKGEKGDTGAAASIQTSSVSYQVGNSGTITPSGTWQSTVPSVPQGKYLWVRTITQFNTGTPITSYSVSRNGLDGAGSVSSVNNVSPGSNGNVTLSTVDVIGAQVVKSMATTFQLGDTGTTPPTGAWSATIPATSAASPYLWTRSVITYTDNTATTSYTVGSTLEGIEVGGRNFLRGTKNFSPIYPYGYGASTVIEETYKDFSVRYLDTSNLADSSIFNFFEWNNAELEPGETYCVSFWAKGSGKIRLHLYGGTGYLKVAKALSSQGVSENHPDGNIDIRLSDSWARYWVIYTMSTTPGEEGVSNKLLFRQFSGNVVYIAGVKFEWGNKATDWTPAPEDMDAAMIGSTVEEFYQSTSATALAGGAWSSTPPVWEKGKYIWRRTLVTYGDGTTAYTPGENGVCISGNPGVSIKEITGFYKAVPEETGVMAPTGGRNLALKTNQGSTHWRQSSQNGTAKIEGFDDDGVLGMRLTCEIKSTGWQYVGFSLNKSTLDNLKPDTEYTVSFDFKKTYPEEIELTCQLSKPTGADILTSHTVAPVAGTNEWVKVELVMTTNDLSGGITDQVLYFGGMNHVGEFYIKNLKFEIGPHSTPWSPAPEDLGWSTSIQSLSPVNKYIWSYEETLFSDYNTSTSPAHIIGVYGNTGATGPQGPKGDTGATGPQGSASSDIVVVTASMTLGAEHEGKFLMVNASGAVQITVPYGHDAGGIPIGSEVEIYHHGSGALTVKSDADSYLAFDGTTAASRTLTIPRYGVISMKKVTGPTWKVSGEAT